MPLTEPTIDVIPRLGSGNYNPSSKLAKARMTKPNTTTQNAKGETTGMGTRPATNPIKPMTTATQNVTSFGIRQFAQEILDSVEDSLADSTCQVKMRTRISGQGEPCPDSNSAF